MIPPHICSMCIKTNKVGKQEVGIWWVQKRFPQYGIPIWSLWPNIRFLSSIVAEKNATKNIFGRTEGLKEVKQYIPFGGAGVWKCHGIKLFNGITTLHLHGFTTVLCWFEKLNGIKHGLLNNVLNQHRRQSIN